MGARIKKTNELFENNLQVYDELVKKIPGLKRKGKKFMYTSANGHMFSYLDSNGNLGIRLPKNERDVFVAQYNTKPFIQYGAVMKEYVSIPKDMFEDTNTLLHYFTLAYHYVRSLEPK